MGVGCCSSKPDAEDRRSLDAPDDPSSTPPGPSVQVGAGCDAPCCSRQDPSKLPDTDSVHGCGNDAEAPLKVTECCKPTQEVTTNQTPPKIGGCCGQDKISQTCALNNIPKQSTEASCNAQDKAENCGAARGSAMDAAPGGEDSCCATKEAAKPTVATKAASIVQKSSLTCCPSSSTKDGQVCSQDACLDFLAYAECRAALYQSNTSGLRQRVPCKTDHNSDGSDGTEVGHKSCSTHRRSVIDRYRAHLSAAGCFCKRVFGDAQLPPCCKPHRSPPSVKSLSSISTSQGLKQGGKVDCSSSKGCCDTKNKSPKTKGDSTTTLTSCSSSGQSAIKKAFCGVGSACCKPTNDEVPTTAADRKPRLVSVFSRDSPYVTKEAKCGPDPCGSSQESGAETLLGPRKKAPSSQDEHRSDAENPEAAEHVVISVGGMTCTGCATKIQKALQAQPGVSNVRVNLVQENAEFDAQTSKMAIEDILKESTRITGFEINKLIINSDSEVIEFAITRRTSDLQSLLLIPGVEDAEFVNSKKLKVTYDSTLIGARALLAAMGSSCTGLAPQSDPLLETGKKSLIALSLATLLATCLTIPVVVLAWGHYDVEKLIKSIVSLILATGVQLIAVREFYIPALRSLIRSHVVEMDMLVCVSITAAYVYSLVAFVFEMIYRPLKTEQFFETSTLLITLVLLGRVVAGLARVRAVSLVSMRSLLGGSAHLIEDGQVQEIDQQLLQWGDNFIVYPHAKIPTDGTVIEGASEVDESMLTGESIPVLKEAGLQIIAGTLNGSGSLTAKLTRLPGNNTVTEIAKLVEDASNSKPRLQDMADKVASYFVAVVGAIATIVLVTWIAVSIRGKGESGGSAIVTGVTYAIAVLAISCPCALGLAVPMVIVVANGVAARRGVVIKSAEALEAARKTTDVIFDKTGTLTTGELEVDAEEFFVEMDRTVALAKGLTQGNTHPVSLAVASHLQKYPTPATNLTDIRVIPGVGVEALFEQEKIRAGNPHWLNVQETPVVRRMIEQGMSILCIASQTELLAVYGLKSQIRPESLNIVHHLQGRNIKVHLVSGDETTAVHNLASTLGIGLDETSARTSPAGKRAYVRALIDQGRFVMFCGDGTNDAVAVAESHVGVQLGSTSDVTRATADVVLLAGLDGLLTFLDISQAAFKRIVFNFVWSALYNVFAILLASGALVVFSVPPAYAGLGEMVSVLPVIVVGLSMFLFNRS
ncbi:hypothetical protein FH972_026458 [Carpinus fangiana]|uniref:HMA domain-containing protein n=1 Tax=Carpinus fangiana TaxID=176857 RepID=A0A5N6L418_9ROSI|nr:hypothetical protein FH972_026458 [Carpinus fangiana]